MGSNRSMPPNPSTMPIRVRAAMVGSGDALAEEELGLLHVGEVLGPGVEGYVEDGRGELGSCLCSSHALMAGHRCLGPRGDVSAVLVEATVASDPIGDQRFDDVVVGQQLRLA